MAFQPLLQPIKQEPQRRQGQRTHILFRRTVPENEKMGKGADAAISLIATSSAAGMFTPSEKGKTISMTGQPTQLHAGITDPGNPLSLVGPAIFVICTLTLIGCVAAYAIFRSKSKRASSQGKPDWIGEKPTPIQATLASDLNCATSASIPSSPTPDYSFASTAGPLPAAPSPLTAFTPVKKAGQVQPPVPIQQHEAQAQPITNSPLNGHPVPSAPLEPRYEIRSSTNLPAIERHRRRKFHDKMAKEFEQWRKNGGKDWAD